MNIRHLAAAVVVAAGLAAGSLISTAAQAMPLPGAIAPANAITSSVEQVRLVCQRVWTGRHWTRRCYHTSPRVHHHHHRYYPPRHHHRHHHHYR